MHAAADFSRVHLCFTFRYLKIITQPLPQPHK